MKTALTPEQSAKLIELGIDPKLASKCRVQHEADDEVEYRIVPHDEFCYEMASLNPSPIFDLSDLLSILPRKIMIHRDGDTLSMIYHCGRWFVGYTNCAAWCGHVKIAPELIDALYQLVQWVVEHDYIPKIK